MFKSDDKFTLEVFDGNGKLVQAEEYSSVEKQRAVCCLAELGKWSLPLQVFKFESRNTQTLEL